MCLSQITIMTIQLFTPTFRVDECLIEIRDCLEKGWTGLGYKTAIFEEEWKKFCMFKNAHFLNSATAGLHLAIRILKEKYCWEQGDEIISTPITFISTNHVVEYENLKVVFADVDKYLCLDPKSVEDRINEHTKAVIFVGYGGSTGQYKKIVEICQKNNLMLILDAAHMAGTRLDGKIPGNEADVIVYSFQAVKNLPTADSGMICFKDPALDTICRKYAWLGINKDTYERSNEKGAYKWKYDVEYLGFKYHGNSIMASIALVQLKYLDIDNAFRRQIASWYDQSFKGFENKIMPVPIPIGCESSRHLYVIEVNNRDELMLALNESDIYPGVHYRDNTEYDLYSYAYGSCPNAHRICRRIISLPMHLRMTKNDVDYVSDIVKKYAN